WLNADDHLSALGLHGFAKRPFSPSGRPKPIPYLSHFFSIMRLSAVFLKLLPAGMRAPPAIRMATCVHEPSGSFLKAAQGTSARPAGYDSIVKVAALAPFEITRATAITGNMRTGSLYCGDDGTRRELG